MSQEVTVNQVVKQGVVAERECLKLQTLLDVKFPGCTMIWKKENKELVLSTTHKRKRNRKVVYDDNDEDDDNDEPETKPKRDVLFKREDDDSDSDKDEHNNNIVESDDDNEEELILIDELEPEHVPVTWGEEPQSPWSQHVDNLQIATTVEHDIQPLYTPVGVGLYFLILSFIYIYFL
jgi:hypothetical protein